MANRRTVTARSGRDAEGELGFRHILVPTDLTERTDKALQLARRLVLSRQDPDHDGPHHRDD